MKFPQRKNGFLEKYNKVGIIVVQKKKRKMLTCCVALFDTSCVFDPTSCQDAGLKPKYIHMRTKLN